MSEKHDQHSLIAALKDLAIELGRTPTRKEFNDRGFSERQVRNHFGQYSVLVQAAGLEPNSAGKPKLTNSIFEKNLETHLSEFKPRARAPIEPLPSMAIISDIHWPFHCQRVIDRFYRWCDDEKPEHIILNGDAMDMYSYSKFPRSHNIFTPKDEEQSARKHNEDFWAQVKRLCPKSKLYQTLGNHDVRPVKRALESMPTMEHWIEKYMTELFSFDGVQTIHDPRQELIIGSVIVHHGFKSQLGAHRDHNLQNTVSSHTHRPGIVYRTVRGSVIFELNTGYAGDPEAKGLTYTPTKTVDWVQSFGAINPDGPRVIAA